MAIGRFYPKSITDLPVLVCITAGGVPYTDDCRVGLGLRIAVEGGTEANSEGIFIEDSGMEVGSVEEVWTKAGADVLSRE
jgi:hypothetical protein